MADRPSAQIRVRRDPKEARYESATIEASLDRSVVDHGDGGWAEPARLEGRALMPECDGYIARVPCWD
jgi:hypothetical protein